MSAVAQRRVAGVTALMILLYLAQVALFASPVSAAVSQPLPDSFPAGPGPDTCPQGGDWSADLLDTANPDIDFGSISGEVDGSVSVTVTDSTYTVIVCIKKGSTSSDLGREFYEVTYESDEQAQVVSHSGGGLSHWSFSTSVNDTPVVPTDDTPIAPTFDISPCDEDGRRTIVATVPVGYQLEITDGGVVDDPIPPNSNTFELSPGSYPWFVHEMNDDTSRIFEGTLTIDPCDTTTTSSTTTTTVLATTASTEATTTTTTQPEGEVLGTTLTTIASESGEEVLGTTITAVPEVSADTLPFTGSESGDLFKLAMLALVAGVLMLFAVRGAKPEEAGRGIGGWSSL